MPNKWKLSYQQESRFPAFDTDDQWDLSYKLTDAGLFLSKKVGVNHGFAIGYQTRFESDLSYRFIQQYTYIRRYSSIRLAHRFSSDQTFSDTWTFRLRYRTTLEKALNGLEVDNNESYFKLNTELLQILESSEYELETRVLPTLGYLFNDQQKIEYGIGYRTKGILTDEIRNQLWVRFTWYWTFN